jgi:hypothetical protein
MVDEPEEGEDVEMKETSPSQNERSIYWVKEEGAEAAGCGGDRG